MMPEPTAIPPENQIAGPPFANAVTDMGTVLCLSGGGFRATLFHLGCLIRLNELGVLSTLSTITSVSGGSILNGFLATKWKGLTLSANGVFSNFRDVIAKPVVQFCSRDLRTPLLIGVRMNPVNYGRLFRDVFSVSGNFLADAYEPEFKQVLGDIPESAKAIPRFVFCATNVRTGACWHFHGGPEARMGDFYVGYCDARNVRVSDAVAASSAFPPGFGALRLRLPKSCTLTRVDPWGRTREVSEKRRNAVTGEVDNPVLLTDGGVYDNMGVEPVWSSYQSILVSDAGRPFTSVTTSRQDIVSRLQRAADISMEQVGAVRRRWLVEGFTSKKRTGAIWTLHTLIEDFNLADAQGYGVDVRKYLHSVRTDLDAFTPAESACLINHGYSLADAAIRTRAVAMIPPQFEQFVWPYPEWAVDRQLEQGLQQSAKRRVLRDTFRYLKKSLFG